MMKMIKMVKWILAISCVALFSGEILAYEKEYEKEEVVEVHNLEEVLQSVKLEKKQIESIVDAMIGTGRLSADEASKVKREISSLKEEDLENIKQKTIMQLKSNNAFATK